MAKDKDKGKGKSTLTKTDRAQEPAEVDQVSNSSSWSGAAARLGAGWAVLSSAVRFRIVDGTGRAGAAGAGVEDDWSSARLFNRSAD
jgi:hypothetical protein